MGMLDLRMPKNLNKLKRKFVNEFNKKCYKLKKVLNLILMNYLNIFMPKMTLLKVMNILISFVCLITRKVNTSNNVPWVCVLDNRNSSYKLSESKNEIIL